MPVSVPIGGHWLSVFRHTRGTSAAREHVKLVSGWQLDASELLSPKGTGREAQVAMSMAAGAATLIEQEPARYEALIRVSQAIGVHRDPAELFRVLMDELRSVVKFDSIGVVQYDEAGNEIAWHLAEKCKEMTDRPCNELPQEESIPWWVYQHQQALVI